ncbi:peptidyl-prolyl cis-trans isomerase [Pirellulaceae bacterium SH501]
MVHSWQWYGWVLLAPIVAGCAAAPKPAASTPPPTSAAAGNTTIVAIQPSAPSCDTTLPKFLGLDSAAQGLGGGLQRIGSRLMSALDLTGRFPGLQPQPPVLPITAPENMGPDAPPAVQAAAEIKKEEDSAQQKIMAIRYLATLGCGGCYEKVEEALLEGLNDCTESVRYEAVRALQCRPDCGCKFCSSPSCCSLAVRKKLDELTRCEKEPSERIRRHARMALACCATKPLDEEDSPREGPTPATPSDSKEAVAKGASIEIFQGIELVSFDAPKTHSTEDVLAVVNREPITKAQIEALMQSGSSGERSLLSSSKSISEEDLRKTLRKVIDWKIIEQHIRSEVRLAGGNQSGAVAPTEIQHWFSKRTTPETYVPATEVAAYYEVHRSKFAKASKVRWEELVVYIGECNSRRDAVQLAEMLRRKAEGYEIQPLSAVNQHQFDTNHYSWMTASTAGSPAIAKCLETLPVGQVGPVIEEDGRLHIVRVLERVPSESRPLAECVTEIQNAIVQERRIHAEQKLLAELRSASAIWTVFDGSKSPQTNPVQTASEVSIQSTP